MVKFKTLDAFYKRKTDGHDTTEITNQNNKRSKASTSEPEPKVLNQPLPDEHIPETGGPNSEESVIEEFKRVNGRRAEIQEDLSEAWNLSKEMCKYGCYNNEQRMAQNSKAISFIRDLGNSNTSGSLGSEVSELKHLQYLYSLAILKSLYFLYFNPYLSVKFLQISRELYWNNSFYTLHGLIRAENMEVGRDSDTGGQVKYVVELARVHLLHVLVMEMLILAIL
ncbi:hypothetical protein L1887_15089 [Cichorium endivia]|nr:hypothetical protein L1887_15089 [Cichorium endivia]